MNKIKKSKKPFYHSYIKADKIIAGLEKSGLTPEEQIEVLELAEKMIHVRAVDAVLEKLPEEKHEAFMEIYASRPEDESIFDFLKEDIKDIDVYLSQTFDSLANDILSDFSDQPDVSDYPDLT